jgi:DNA-binding NarL/FixJ family response regulator
MNGFSLLREIKGSILEVKILALSIHESDQYVLQAFEAMADGYAIKHSSREVERARHGFLREVGSERHQGSRVGREFAT